MEYRCVDICPLPSNATDRVDSQDLVRRLCDWGINRKTVEESRRFRSFKLPDESYHCTSVVILTVFREGIKVTPESYACEDIIGYYNFGLNIHNRGGAIGGGIRCAHLNQCTYWFR